MELKEHKRNKTLTKVYYKEQNNTGFTGRSKGGPVCVLVCVQMCLCECVTLLSHIYSTLMTEPQTR